MCPLLLSNFISEENPGIQAMHEGTKEWNDKNRELIQEGLKKDKWEEYLPSCTLGLECSPGSGQGALGTEQLQIQTQAGTFASGRDLLPAGPSEGVARNS